MLRTCVLGFLDMEPALEAEEVEYLRLKDLSDSETSLYSSSHFSTKLTNWIEAPCLSTKQQVDKFVHALRSNLSTSAHERTMHKYVKLGVCSMYFKYVIKTLRSNNRDGIVKS